MQLGYDNAMLDKLLKPTEAVRAKLPVYFNVGTASVTARGLAKDVHLMDALKAAVVLGLNISGVTKDEVAILEVVLSCWNRTAQWDNLRAVPRKKCVAAAFASPRKSVSSYRFPL
jgi:hypothetical protein